MQKILCYIWAKIYSKWLFDDEYPDKVFGWRTARVRYKNGMVKWTQPCFWIFK